MRKRHRRGEVRPWMLIVIGGALFAAGWIRVLYWRGEFTAWDLGGFGFGVILLMAGIWMADLESRVG